jgi:hypothetical protein
MRDGATDGGRICGLHRGHHQHATLGGWFEKGSQQFLLLLPCEVLVMTAAQGLTPQHGLSWTEVVRMHLPHGADLPTQGRRNLGGGETQSGS